MKGSWHGERGFTVPEVLVVITIMGILLTIATSTWSGLIEARRVDSSTNQMAAELRRAHTSATNRLETWQVDLNPAGAPDSGDYDVGPCEAPCGGAPLPPPSRSLEEGTEFPPGMGGVRVVFHPNGEAEFIPPLAGNVIQIAADDGSPCHEIELNEITSRIKVATNAC